MYTIRPYAPQDLAPCAQCLLEGFFTCPASPKDMAFLQDYTRLLVHLGNFTLVALYEGQVVGFVCGQYSKSFSPALAGQHPQKMPGTLLAKIYAKFLLGLYRFSPAFNAQWKLFLQKLRQRPKGGVGPCQCELAALTSRAAFRKGLGTALVNAFMQQCRQNGAHTIRLLTNTAATYLFYEKYGFTRVNSQPFHLPLPGGGAAEGETYIYQYNLEQAV